MKKETHIAPESAIKQAQPTQFVRVLFGMQSLNCQRLGICRLISTDEEDEVLMAKSAVARLTVQKDCIVFHFLRKTIGRVNQAYFTNNVFEIGENYAVPSAICTQLGIKEATILRGSYRMEKADTAAEWSFKMKISTLVRKPTKGLKVAKYCC